MLATAAVAGVVGGTFAALSQVSGPATNVAVERSDDAGQAVDASDRVRGDRAGRSHPMATAHVEPSVGSAESHGAADTPTSPAGGAGGPGGAASVLASATKPASPVAKPTSPAPAGGATDTVISLVNAERAKAGCGAVTSNAKLTSAAVAHSQDMATRGYFEHDTPEGVSAAERLTDAGYRWSTMGENIAYGQPTAQSVMTAWMNSKGHKDNILNCSFKEIGVGLVYTSGRTPYWTQDFGTAR